MRIRLLTARTFLLLAAFSFFSCKKSSTATDDHNYFVKLKINGSWVTWTAAVGELGPDLADASKTDFGVTANDDAMKDVFDLSIQVDGTTFNTGSYASDDYFMPISYSKAPGTANGKFFLLGQAPTGPSSQYTVNISSITSKELRGTFTGNYLYDSYAEESMIITEGEFFVGRLR